MPGGTNDLVISGTVNHVVGGVTNTYSGVLVTGTVTQFGFLQSATSTNQSQFEFRFAPTGGALVGLICSDMAIHINSAGSTFTNSFAVNFQGQADGITGAENIIPPQITCPTNITEEAPGLCLGCPAPM